MRASRATMRHGGNTGGHNAGVSGWRWSALAARNSLTINGRRWCATAVSSWEAGILPLNYARGVTATALTRSGWLSRPVVTQVVTNPTLRSASRRPPNLATCCSRRYSTASARFGSWHSVPEYARGERHRTRGTHDGRRQSTPAVSLLALSRRSKHNPTRARLNSSNATGS